PPPRALRSARAGGGHDRGLPLGARRGLPHRPQPRSPGHRYRPRGPGGQGPGRGRGAGPRSAARGRPSRGDAVPRPPLPGPAAPGLGGGHGPCLAGPRHPQRGPPHPRGRGRVTDAPPSPASLPRRAAYPGAMERPCLSRRRALMLPASAVAVGGIAACAPEGEGFGTSEPVRAEDGEIDLAEVPENASTLVNFGGQQPFALLVRGSGEDITAYS